MTVGAKYWSDISSRKISLDAIMEAHVPPSHYRISPSRYEAGVCFSGFAQAGRLYVLTGACFHKVGVWEVELQAGMFVDFPAGEFEFKVVGEESVQVVKVWLIPEQYRSRSA